MLIKVYALLAVTVLSRFYFGWEFLFDSDVGINFIKIFYRLGRGRNISLGFFDSSLLVFI